MIKMKKKERKELAQRMSEHKLKTNGLLAINNLKCIFCKRSIKSGELFYDTTKERGCISCVDTLLKD